MMASMSDYKTVLVHADAGKATARRFDLALQLGARFDAHVAALYALDSIPTPSNLYEAGAALREAQARLHQDMRDGARKAWDEALRRSGHAKAEWRESGADCLDAVALHARYADLVVIGQQNPDEGSGVDRRLERDLPLAAGRAVVVVPYIYAGATIGKHVIVAWNASREAARSVREALPMLKAASHVHVLTLGKLGAASGHGEEPGADIALYLTRHGVKVTVTHDEARGMDPGNLLLSRAADLGADMIVMGAWGHSRLHERVLGGVTRTLLLSMTVPLFMAH